MPSIALNSMPGRTPISSATGVVRRPRDRRTTNVKTQPHTGASQEGRHTFGRRLRAVGFALETRKVLLGHANGDITTHYSAAELKELIDAVEKIVSRGVAQTPTLTLVRQSAGRRVGNDEKGCRRKPCKSLRKLARPERLELPTTWFEARYSIQLSYGRGLARNATQL